MVGGEVEPKEKGEERKAKKASSPPTVPDMLFSSSVELKGISELDPILYLIHFRRAARTYLLLESEYV